MSLRIGVMGPFQGPRGRTPISQCNGVQQVWCHRDARCHNPYARNRTCGNPLSNRVLIVFAEVSLERFECGYVSVLQTTLGNSPTRFARRSRNLKERKELQRRANTPRSLGEIAAMKRRIAARNGEDQEGRVSYSEMTVKMWPEAANSRRAVSASSAVL
jgi:hypothetical protein